MYQYNTAIYGFQFYGSVFLEGIPITSLTNQNWSVNVLTRVIKLIEFLACLGYFLINRLLVLNICEYLEFDKLQHNK